MNLTCSVICNDGTYACSSIPLSCSFPRQCPFLGHAKWRGGGRHITGYQHPRDQCSAKQQMQLSCIVYRLVARVSTLWQLSYLLNYADVNTLKQSLEREATERQPRVVSIAVYAVYTLGKYKTTKSASNTPSYFFPHLAPGLLPPSVRSHKCTMKTQPCLAHRSILCLGIRCLRLIDSKR